MEYLQKNFTPCAWCIKYGEGRMVFDVKNGSWFDDEVLHERLNSSPMSHGICPECKDKTLAEMDNVCFGDSKRGIS